MFSLSLYGRWAVPVVVGLVALGAAPSQALSRAEAAGACVRPHTPPRTSPQTPRLPFVSPIT